VVHDAASSTNALTPGNSWKYVGTSVPVLDANRPDQESSLLLSSIARMSLGAKLYSPVPDCCCSLVCDV
jgi:hypothetical protein